VCHAPDVFVVRLVKRRQPLDRRACAGHLAATVNWAHEVAALHQAFDGDCPSWLVMVTPIGGDADADPWAQCPSMTLNLATSREPSWREVHRGATSPVWSPGRSRRTTSRATRRSPTTAHFAASSCGPSPSPHGHMPCSPSSTPCQHPERRDRRHACAPPPGGDRSPPACRHGHEHGHLRRKDSRRDHRRLLARPTCEPGDAE
jgi:hypothetical protein